MNGLAVQRLGEVMVLEPNKFMEIEGVLNPAAVRGHVGQLYLFPRLVGQGNYARIGNARVQFDSAAHPHPFRVADRVQRREPDAATEQ